MASQVTSGQGGAEECPIGLDNRQESEVNVRAGPESSSKGMNGDPCLPKKCLTLEKDLWKAGP